MAKKNARKSGKKPGIKPAVLAFLLVPPAIYAVYVMTLFVLDTFWGDNLMLYQFMHESRRHAVLQILSDGWCALPVFYAVGLPLWAEAFLLSRFLDWRGALPAAAAGALTSLLLTLLFVGKSASAIIPFVLSGFLVAGVFGWVAQRTNLYKRR